MNNRQQLLVILAIGVGLVVAVLGISLFPRGERPVSALTNVHGVAYGYVAQEALITQALAHLDVELREPVAFKKLELTFEFDPKQIQTLAVGVRDNPFWLSYQPTVFYDADAADSRATQAARVIIPLTDKLQDADRSIDVMFIANGQTEVSLKDELGDSTHWSISDIRAEVTYDWPTWAAAKDYARAVLTRERPL